MRLTIPLFEHSKEPRAKANYQLTELGKKKAEDVRLVGTRGDVMSILDTAGACTLSEIAKEAKLSPERTKRIINSLISDGWVRKIAGEM